MGMRMPSEMQRFAADCHELKFIRTVAGFSRPVVAGRALGPSAHRRRPTAPAIRVRRPSLAEVRPGI